MVKFLGRGKAQIVGGSSSSTPRGHVSVLRMPFSFSSYIYDASVYRTTGLTYERTRVRLELRLGFGSDIAR